MVVGDEIRLTRDLFLTAIGFTVPSGTGGYIRGYDTISQLFEVRFKILGFLVYVDEGLLEVVA